MTHFTISITSDTVCPWCYIGSRRLNKAIAQHKQKYPDDTFATQWLPFYLNPNAPKQGVDKRGYYVSKFGEAHASQIFQRLSAAGQSEGINFSFGGRTGNTRDSHRLLQHAMEVGGEALQTRVVEELFKSYFEQEEDITSHQVLQGAAERAGFDSQKARDLLESDAEGIVVDKEVKKAQSELVTGVPHFVIQDRYEISGAQEPAAFLQIFNRVKHMAY